MRYFATARVAALLMLASSWSSAAPVPVIEITDATGAPLAGGQANLSGPAVSARNSVQQEMLFTLQQLQDEVRSLRGKVEEQEYRLKQMEQEQRERYRDMDRRISLLMAAVPEEALLAAQNELNSAAQPAPSGEGSPVSGTAGTASAVDNAVDNESAALGEQDAYDQAYGQVRQRNYARAEASLDAFLRQYPDSSLAPNAWYWLGEVKLAQGKSEAAAQAFNQVLTAYPDHAKSADALYKLGVLAQRGGDRARAQALMQRVLNEYPQTAAAGLARSFLTTQY